MACFDFVRVRPDRDSLLLCDLRLGQPDQTSTGPWRPSDLEIRVSRLFGKAQDRHGRFRGTRLIVSTQLLPAKPGQHQIDIFVPRGRLSWRPLFRLTPAPLHPEGFQYIGHPRSHLRAVDARR